MRGPNDPKATARHIYASRHNYYVLFGVERNCTADEISRKYKRIALQLHPDKAGGDEYLIKAFLIAQEAKETLSDAKKRSAYDQYGADGVKQYESTGRAGPAPRAQAFHAGGDGPQDLFDLFFGAQARANDRRRAQQRAQYQQQQQRQPHFQQNGEQIDINLGTMMLAPLLLFVFLILLFSSRSFDVTPTSVSSRQQQASRYNTQDIIPPFHLHPNQKDGCVIQKSLTVGGKKVDYYVRRDFSVYEGRNQIDRVGLENSVMVARRDYLRRRCKAEMNKQERGVGIADLEVCDDLDLFKRVLRDRGIYS